MGFSKKKQFEIAEQVRLAYARELFKDHKDFEEADSYNPNLFPRQVATLAAMGTFTSFPHKIKKDIEDYAAKIAFEEAVQLMTKKFPEQNFEFLPYENT